MNNLSSRKYWRVISAIGAVVAVVALLQVAHPLFKTNNIVQAASSDTITFGLTAYDGNGNYINAANATVTTNNDSQSGTSQEMNFTGVKYIAPSLTNSNGGTFTTDFRIGVQVCEYPGNNCGTGWTDWASDIAKQGFDVYSAPALVVSAVPSHNRFNYVTTYIQTRPLPPGTSFNAEVGSDLLEQDYFIPNNQSEEGTVISTDMSADCGGTFTPATGGTGSSAGATNYLGVCGASASNDPDVIALTINAYNMENYHAQFVSTTIPSVFGSGETKQSLQIVMQNTGTSLWPMQKGPAVAGSQSGTCQIDVDGSGVNDAPSATSTNGGKSCTTNFTYSTTFTLDHSGLFGVDPAKAITTKTVPVTITYLAPKKICFPSPPNESCPRMMVNCPGPIICETGGAGYIYSYGGVSRNINSGDQATFVINKMTAPIPAGTYNETWEMDRGGTLFVAPFTKTITVGTPGNSGTINVVSYATDTTTGQQVQIPATWIVSGPQTINQSVATSSATYGNLPLGTYILAGVDTQVPGMSLRNVHMVVAQNPRENMMTGLLAMLGEPFSVAHAETVSVFQNGGSWMGNSGTLGQPPYNVLTFGVQWQQNGLQYHLACVGNSCAYVNSIGSNQNGCTAVGQTCTGGGGQISASLSAYPSSGTVPLTSTVTATVMNGAAPYTYSFWQNCGYVGSDVAAATKQCGKPTVRYASVSSPTENATFTYNQIGSDTPLVIVNSGTNSVNAATTVTVNSPAGGCSPAGSTQSCTSAANACGQVNSGTETCSSGGVWGACSATVPSNDLCPVGPSSCSSFTASSTTILPGEYSTLSWTCTNVTSCSIDNGGGSGGATGTSQVNPTSTTVYTLSCNGTAVTSTTVIVQNPGQIEINP